MLCGSANASPFPPIEILPSIPTSPQCWHTTDKENSFTGATVDAKVVAVPFFVGVGKLLAKRTGPYGYYYEDLYVKAIITKKDGENVAELLYRRYTDTEMVADKYRVKKGDVIHLEGLKIIVLDVLPTKIQVKEEPEGVDACLDE